MTAVGNDRGLDWRRSRYCADHACVEVARNGDGDVLVRDSKHPHGTVLNFPADSWKAFLAAVHDGHFTDR